MEKPNISKDFLSMAEVGARLGLTRQSAFRIVVQEGRIPHVRHGRNVRVPVSAWEMWLAAQHDAAMVGASAAAPTSRAKRGEYADAH